MWAATALPAASTLNNYCQHPAPQQQSDLAVSTIDQWVTESVIATCQF